MTSALTGPATSSSVKALENDPDIKPIHKALILWVAIGKKPATWLIIESNKWKKGSAETRISKEKWDYYDRMLTGLGLKYVIRTRLSDDTFVQPKNGDQLWVELGDIFIARTTETALLLANACKAKDNKRLGELFGFPESSITAYISKDVLPSTEIPKYTDDVSEDEMKFLNHMISKQNWESELRYLPIFANDIKHISPKIYMDCVAG